MSEWNSQLSSTERERDRSKLTRRAGSDLGALDEQSPGQTLSHGVASHVEVREEAVLDELGLLDRSEDRSVNGVRGGL